MKGTIARIIATSICLTSLSTVACDIDGKSGYLPKNDMYIGVNSLVSNGMTEEIFNHVMDRAIEHFEPIIEEKGKKLKFHRKWEDGTVNAYANQSGKTWNVHMFGGLARHELVSADGFALVVCHELGHHLAGAPKIRRFFSSSWASNEGQSDYWASMKCFRRIYRHDNNQEIVSNMTISPVVTEKCESHFTTADEVALCKRVSQAAKGLAQLLNGGRDVSFSTPDTKVVSKTNDKHPAGQCRLDTYFNGALCDKSITDTVSNKDAKKGVCNLTEGYETAVRPLCWFKPKK